MLKKKTVSMVLTIALAVSLLAMPVSAAEEQSEEVALSVESETETKDEALNELESLEQGDPDETNLADTAREEISEAEPADKENDIQTLSANDTEPTEKDDVSAVTVSDYSDGFHQDPDSSDWCYYQDGKIATGRTGLIQGTVNGTSGYWNIVKGRVVASVDVVKGTVDGTTAWWYVNKNGMVDTSYTGFAANGNGTWYAESGRVSKKANGVYKDSSGAIGAKNNWYYVLNSKVQYDFTGLANYKNASGWWYITKGKVDRSVTTVAKNKNGWYYVKNGKVNRSYTGFATNSSGSWYVKSGKVSKKVNGVYKDASGAIGAKNNWYYVLNSKVQYNYTGIASNENGFWYIQNGKVDRSYTGTYKFGSTTYTVTNGKVNLNVNRENHTLTGDDLSILSGDKGLLSSRSLSKNQYYNLIGQFMGNSIVKNTGYSSPNESASWIWNGGARWDCSATSLYFINYYLLPYANGSATGKKAKNPCFEAVNSVSQAMTWGNPVYTYNTANKISGSHPGNLRYGDLLFYGTKSKSCVTIDHASIYLGQYYLSQGDTTYYMLENNGYAGNVKEGRKDGVKIVPFNTSLSSSLYLVHTSRIF